MFTTNEIKQMHNQWLADLKQCSPEELKAIVSATEKSGIADTVEQLKVLVKKAKQVTERGTNLE